MKTIFSGVQPSGNLHIGNYIGALKQWVSLQSNNEAIFCIVDLHAITVPQDPKTLREKILEVAALYLAIGIDPKKAHIFVQSENPNHANLAWILNTITPFGQLERMTQFKEKGEKHGENVGLFDYPVLMAADILLYQTDEVPVGEDQKQHLELTRDLAEKFNSKFGQTFKIPVPVIQREAARIMSLQNPTSKMSKSDNNPLGTINLLDTQEQIREKIKKAVTDSETHISKDKGSEGLSNLLTIYSVFKNQTLSDSYNELEGKSYGEFKDLLADLVVSELSEVQKKYNEIRVDEKSLMLVLNDGRDYAIEKSNVTMKKVVDVVGLGRSS
ncbi:MAG: tryptophan--tRNA ligase [Candidatus Levyibacteriota bacterium]